MVIDDLKEDFGILNLELQIQDDYLFHYLDEDIVVTQKDFDILDKYMSYVLKGDFSDVVDVFEKEFNVKTVNGEIDLGDLAIPLWLAFNCTKFPSQNRYINFFNSIMSGNAYRKAYMAKNNFKDMITNMRNRKELTNGGSSYFNALYGTRRDNGVYTEESNKA